MDITDSVQDHKISEPPWRIPWKNHYFFWHMERRSCRGHGPALIVWTYFLSNFIKLENKSINYFGDAPKNEKCKFQEEMPVLWKLAI